MNVPPVKKRIAVVDALRGFAVMAIMILHNVERFNLYIFPEKSSLPEWMVKMDKVVWDSMFFMFGGKAYAIFALLFGFTFFLQFNSRLSKNEDFGYTFLWRLLLLLGFAMFNAALFPGEVLLLFAVVGLFLFVARHWQTKWVFLFATVLLLQPMEIGRYVYHLFNPEYQLPEGIMGPHYNAFKQIVREGEFWSTIKAHLYHGQIFSFMWAVENGRFFQTAGLFLMGMLAGRGEVFYHTRRNTKFWSKTLVVSVIAFIPLWWIVENKLGGLTQLEMKTMGASIKMWRNLAFTGVLVSSFVLLYYQTAFEKILERLIPYGKMSLTNYIFQSLIGFIIYFPVCFYLSPKISTTYSFLLGIALFFGHLHLCKWWLKHHRQGPLEYIWHKLTWVFKEK